MKYIKRVKKRCLKWWKKMENVIAQNRTTSFKDHHLKDIIINMVKLIKQENWNKIMKNSDSLFEWLDLNSNLRLLFENVRNDVQCEKWIFTNPLRNFANQILNKVWRSSDKDLESHGINNCLDASIMAIEVFYHCQQVTKMFEALNSASKELMKMNNIILNLLTIGSPNLANSNSRFIGKENYMKNL